MQINHIYSSKYNELQMPAQGNTLQRSESELAHDNNGTPWIIHSCDKWSVTRSSFFDFNYRGNEKNYRRDKINRIYDISFHI